MPDVAVLMVPMHLDALHLRQPQAVLSAMADFGNLPFFDGRRDVNADTPNLAESILTQPFQDKNFYLDAGIHLHWALPDALHHAIHSQGKLHFLPAPNRWLVTRTRGRETAQWVVESNYICPPHMPATGAVRYPASDHLGTKPYRFLGRTIARQHWHEAEQADPSLFLQDLTAFGYGEPTFAAFYPNCHSVFGFFDADVAAWDEPALNGVTYDVIGWHSDEAQDCLTTQVVQDALALYQQRTASAQPELGFIQKEFGWTFEGLEQGMFPQRTVYYAQLTIAAETIASALPDSVPATVVVGNTVSEALSTYLASLSGGDAVQVEDQLEALHLLSALDGRRLDTGALFRHARHAKGFRPVAGGQLWTIRPKASQPGPASAPDAPRGQVTLPTPLADQLDELNTAQQGYDRARAELDALRQQLFADWYKYMLASYPPDDSHDDLPDSDEVRFFIERTSLPTIQRHQAIMSALETRIHQAAGDLAHALQEHEIDAGQTGYELRTTAGPRYWQPHDPVVLIAHPSMIPTQRHGEDGRLRADGLLDCVALTIGDFSGQIAGHLDFLRSRVAELRPADGQERIGFSRWTNQPWHPFLLEWRAEVFPVAERGNLRPEARAYDPAFVTSHYRFADGGADLMPGEPQPALTRGALLYSGRSILTNRSQDQVSERIAAYLGERQPDPDEPFANALAAIQHQIQASQTQPMAQSLGGFHEALLQHKRTLQLPIADPLGFLDAQAFTDQVRAAVQRSTTRAPQPLDDFSPIRAGAMRLTGLRLVDTFGRVQTLLTEATSAQVLASASLGSLPPSHILLPPRIAQPARLNLRWLSASHGGAASADDVEMNSHPATSPIVGWVVPNLLDGTLLIYEQSGQALGSIQRQNGLLVWRAAPGRPFQFNLEEILNPHLRRWVAYLVGQDQAFFEGMLVILEHALEHIDPESAAQHEALALLMGRPLALARATIGLELHGLPALNQDWNVFRQDLRRDTRDTDAFTAVRFPVRLGDEDRLNDGLVGYWVEADDGSVAQTLYTPQTPEQPIDHPHIVTGHGDERPQLVLAINTPPQTVLLLLDPRAEVHAVTGILPTKAIRVPPDQYVDALRALEVSFLTAPIITSGQAIELALPTEPGFTWAWIERENGIWKRTTDIEPARDEATLATPHMLREGWLILRQDTTDTPQTEP